MRVEIAVAAGNVEAAGAAADELDSFAQTYGTTALKAAAQCARGAIQLTEGNFAEAVTSLRRGLKLWQEAECPYEVAKARMLLAEAYSSQGNEESARVELRSARSSFNRLGAVPDSRRASELLGEAPAAEVSRELRTFMFTDIVRSTDLVEAMGDEAWQDLIDWHDQALRSRFVRHHGEEIKHAGDGFFVAFEDAKRAIDCGIAIQKSLADHRKAHGFAPQVRIGLHRDEATRSGRDYMGKGVNRTARIAAAAGAGEILASEDTVGAKTGTARSVKLKGITEAARLVSIDWQK